MARRKQVFACMRGEHLRVEGCPDDQTTMAGVLYKGGICKFCFCVYYEPLGEPGLILMPKGNA